MASWVPVPFYLYLCVKSVHPSGLWFPLKRSVDIYVFFSVQPTPQGQEWHLIGLHQNVQFLGTRDKTLQNRDHKMYCLNWFLLTVKDTNNYKLNQNALLLFFKAAWLETKIGHYWLKCVDVNWVQLSLCTVGDTIQYPSRCLNLWRALSPIYTMIQTYLSLTYKLGTERDHK